MYDLSILIPARNEMFIAKTVEDILAHKRAKTEIIVGLDGEWAEPGIVDHPDVRIVYVAQSIGQRAMTNKLARLSTAKYVAKCDAHCSFDEGFDEKLLEAIKGHDDWTIIPTMYNLHAFDWKCPKCGSKWYQGPTPTRCMRNVGYAGKGTEPNPDCDNTKGFYRKLVWKPRERGPANNAYRFDNTLHFQYFREFNKRPEGQGDITPTMSLQGSFFMLTRERYWSLNMCDEKTGSWGQQGVEVACKTWLSGGEVMVVHSTWYAHMFRTQGGDFTFPYPQSERAVQKARQYSQDIWFNNKFDKQIYPLKWLIKKFAPVPDWEDVESLPDLPTKPIKGIIYYTDNQLPTKLAHRVQDQIKKAGLPIVSATLKSMSKMGKNIIVQGQRGYLTMFKQILAALEASTSDVIFFCEHDVLYHSSHFDFTPPEKNMFYYNHNFWRIGNGDMAVHWDANQVSGLCCYREYAIDFYRHRIELLQKEEFDRSYEPGGRDESLSQSWKSLYPNIDIRGHWNMTKSKWSLDDFRDKSTATNFEVSTIDKIPGWNDLQKLLK